MLDNRFADDGTNDVDPIAGPSADPNVKTNFQTNAQTSDDRNLE